MEVWFSYNFKSKTLNFIPIHSFHEREDIQPWYRRLGLISPIIWKYFEILLKYLKIFFFIFFFKYFLIFRIFKNIQFNLHGSSKWLELERYRRNLGITHIVISKIPNYFLKIRKSKFLKLPEKNKNQKRLEIEQNRQNICIFQSFLDFVSSIKPYRDKMLRHCSLKKRKIFDLYDLEIFNFEYWFFFIFAVQP